MDKPNSLPRSPTDFPTADPKLQQRLTSLLSEISYHGLLARLSPAAKAVRVSLHCKGAALPLYTIPSCRQLTYSNETFRLFLRSFQLIDIFASEITPFPACPCQNLRQPAPHASPNHRTREAFPVRQAGSPGESNLEQSTAAPVGPPAHKAGHFYACAASSGMSNRHDEVARELMHLINSVRSTIVSDCLLSQQARANRQSKLRPDIEVLGFGPSYVTKTYVEVSVVNVTQQRYLNSAGLNPLAAAKQVEYARIKQYESYFQQAEPGCRVLAAIFEATGAFGKGVHSIVRECSERTTPREFEEETAHLRTWASQKFNHYWKQRIACAFWRGHTEMIKLNLQAIAAANTEAAAFLAELWAQRPVDTSDVGGPFLPEPLDRPDDDEERRRDWDEA